MRNLGFVLLSSAFILFGGSGMALAQTGAIAGTVTDVTTGQPVEGAVVEAGQAQAAPTAVATSGADGRFRIENLAPGAYDLVVRTFTFEELRRPNVRVAAGETATVEILLTARVFAGEAITVTASRKREALVDAPATVAVVDSQALAERPAVSPVDHLRGVTGVDQISYGLQSANVVTRGFNNLFSGALLTLTDYRIASVPSLQVNLLHLEPAANEDLERIEVVLGPGAALYGPNTANGVLHMMTRSPLEHRGTRVSVSGGERDLMQVSFRSAHGMGEAVGIKVSGQYVRGNEWEFIDPIETIARQQVEANPAGCVARWTAAGIDPAEATGRCARTGHRNFDLERWTLDGRADWRISPEWTAVFSGGVARAIDAIELTGIGAGQVRDWTKYYYQARASRGTFFGQVYLNGTNSGDTFLLQNGASIIDRSKLLVGQLQHGFALGDRQSFTYGIDVLRTLPETDGSINGRYEDDDDLTQVGGYIHSETGLARTLNLVLAGRLDHTTALDKVVFSPRAGLVYTPVPGHSLRATYNSAVETPSSLNMFLDIHGGGVPDPTLAALGYGLRAQGPGFDGVDLVGSDGLPLGMRSPFYPDPAQLLPVHGSTLWALAVGIMQAQGRIDGATAQELLQLDAAALGINALDPNTRALSPLDEAGIEDVPRLEESRQTTIELGYNGLLASQRLLVAADVWYTEKSDFISPLMSQTPFLLLEGTTTVQMLVPYFMGKGMSQEQATATAIGMVAGDPNVIGDGIAEVPLGVASSPGVNAVGADLLATYRNFGRVDLWGADISARVLLSNRWSAAITGSWVSDDHFRLPLQGTEQILALNAPTVKGSAALTFRDSDRGFNAEGRVRHHNSFPANSAGYVGLDCVGVAGSPACVEDATLADLTLGSRLPGVDGASVQLTVQNIFDTPYRSFVRVPAIGRMALLRLTYEF